MLVPGSSESFPLLYRDDRSLLTLILNGWRRRVQYVESVLWLR